MFWVKREVKRESVRFKGNARVTSLKTILILLISKLYRVIKDETRFPKFCLRKKIAAHLGKLSYGV